MSDVTHLIVETGPDKGKSMTVPPDGARIGRSSKNDIVLTDPMVSRHHSRFMFKSDGRLWIADLGSANQTLVNDVPAQQQALKKDDRIELGDTILRVVNDGTAVTASAVDLGLQPTATEGGRRALGRGPLWVGLLLVVAVALGIWIPRLLPDEGGTSDQDTAPVRPAGPQSLAIAYEKIEASATNIFRYYLELEPKQRILSIQIDDLLNDRHVRKEKELAADYVQELASMLEGEGFFGLGETYHGIREDVLERWDLTVTCGSRTHRSVVENRVPPDAFRGACERLEHAGQNELGLWAIQFSPARLRELARDARLEGKRLYDARDVEDGNLAAAIRSFREAEWYLETVEPKPDDYAEMMNHLSEAEAELQQRFEDRNFSAERAIRLRQWEEAASELRTICRLIPERSDKRHQESRDKLLDVETRLKLIKEGRM